MPYSNSVEARLVRRLRVVPNGCWEWIGKVNAGGYGTMGINMKGRSRRVALVHRVAAWLWLGVDLDGDHEVCHDCDNKRCCNPNEGHIRPGTRSENMRAAYDRGLQPSRKGEANGRARITMKQASQIRKLYATGKFSQKKLADRFGVTQQTVSGIVRGKTWT